MLAGDVFRQAIAARKHEEPPPPAKPKPVEIEQGLLPTALVRDTWGDPTPPERLAIETGAPVLSFRVEIARSLAPEAWAEADASLKKADAVLAVVEKRRAA
jgi:hypothetical protein